MQINLGEFLPSNYSRSSINVFCDASWIDCNSHCGLGFIIVSHINNNLIVGALSTIVESNVKAELAATLALNHCLGMNMCPSAIYSDCIPAVEMLRNGNVETDWQFLEALNNVKRLLHLLQNTTIHYVPRDLNTIAEALANYRRLNPGLSLFHKGLQLPNWLMDITKNAALTFE